MADRMETTVAHIKDQQTALKPVNMVITLFGERKAVKNLVGRDGKYMVVVEDYKGRNVAVDVAGHHTLEVEWVVR